MVEEILTEWVWGAWLCWIFPIAGALLTPLFAKINHKFRDYAAVFFSFLGAISAISLIPLLINGRYPIHNSIDWVTIPGTVTLKAEVLVDPLSIIMTNVVAIISFLIMVYSLGYMHGDPSLTRYWFFMNFFIGNMLILVTAGNLVQMLFGWEGVGLCSYALIGFWYRDSKEDWLKCWVGEEPEAYPPSHCGLKAFITTRLGDVFMLIGVFIVFALTGTVSFLDLTGAFSHVGEAFRWLIVPATILIFGGAIGKSAQLPLMEWLPDAMAGPTTVSALIHAATMVKAGVYLVGRMFPIIYAWSLQYPDLITFFQVVGWIGALTAFVAATQAVASSEIKKVLAYSTVSQLGYMMLALGVAGASTEFIIGYSGGVFHLMSHAMFKAALFLSAGAVIHATGSRFLRHYGSLNRKMPKTFVFMTLAGFSLMGVPVLFSGFWSKDMVLEAALVSNQYLIFALGAITAAITSFYTMRMLGLTFFGEESQHQKELEEEGRHIHEAPPVMWVPYGALVAGTIAFGVAGLFVGKWIEHIFHEYLHLFIRTEHTATYTVQTLSHHATPENLLFGLTPVQLTMAISITMLLIGVIPGYLIYFKRKKKPEEIVDRSAIAKSIWKFLFRRWYINTFYYKAFIHSYLSLSRKALKYVEMKGIDAFNYLLAKTFRTASSKFRKTHIGVLSYNLLLIMAGFFLIIFIFAYLGLMAVGV